MSGSRVDPEVGRLIEEARQLPDCAARNALYERVASAAEALGDLDSAWHARCAILESSASHAAPRFENLFLSLAWCLAVSDADPDRFPASRVLWQYKWVATDAPRYAAVPKRVLFDLVSDMDQRFIAAGWGPRAGIHKRLELLQVLGDPSGALELVQQWHAAPRDRGSDCKACECSSLCEILADAGHHDQAIREARAIISGQLSCSTVPHSTFGHLLGSFLILGKPDLARSLYDKGRRLVAALTEGAPKLSAPYLLFAAYIGDIENVVSTLRSRLPGAMSLTSDEDRLRWFGLAAVAARLLAARGVPVLDAHALEASSDLPSLDTGLLAAQFAEIAGRHAARLDARNGSRAKTDWLKHTESTWLAFPAPNAAK